MCQFPRSDPRYHVVLAFVVLGTCLVPLDDRKGGEGGERESCLTHVDGDMARIRRGWGVGVYQTFEEWS